MNAFSSAPRRVDGINKDESMATAMNGTTHAHPYASSSAHVPFSKPSMPSEAPRTRPASSRHSRSSSGMQEASNEKRHSSGSSAASKNVLTIALQKAQSAVLLDSANNLPAAIAAYTQSVRLLSEVMQRCEEALERERERGRKARDSGEPEDPRRRERREKRERLKEDEARRLRVIHDTYADRIRMLTENLSNAVTPEVATTRPSSLATVTNNAPLSRRGTLSEITSAPVIQVDDSSVSQTRHSGHDRWLHSSPPASPLDPMFAPTALQPAPETTTVTTPTTPQQGYLTDEDRTPKPSEAEEADEEQQSRRDYGPLAQKLSYDESNGVGLGVMVQPRRPAYESDASRQRSGESIVSYHRPTSSSHSTVTDSFRLSSAHTSTTTIDETPPAPPPKFERSAAQRISSLAASPTLRTSAFQVPRPISESPAEETGLALLSSYQAGREHEPQRPPLHTAQTSPTIPLSIHVPKRSASATSAPISAVSVPSPSQSGSISRKSSMSALIAPPSTSRLPVLPPIPADLLESLPKVRQPFRLMRQVVGSIAQGAYVSPRLFVARQVWDQTVKLNKLEPKIRLLDEMAAVCENGRLEDIERAAGALREGTKKLVSQKDKPGWGNKMLSKGLEKMNSRSADTLPAYCDSITRSFLAAQILDRQLAELYRMSMRERHIREAILHRLSEFYGTVVCPIVLADLGVLLDKYVKKTSGSD